ncbi:hypothetical protein BDW02DRAFT_567614 [Decorospora gaudefroyi]|uniref:Uncharacterized protein n=1 Tax=Decorospora gaudefroyi TaxID=184978 RepID=A0A6A5KNA1_9PLEO|nr:hypothetical protein BDW02DRAFT_567614 [Decorospora gaudefroyi]
MSATDTPVEGWVTKSPAEKKQYLQTQFLVAGQTSGATLWDCVERGQTIVKWGKCVYVLIQAIHDDLGSRVKKGEKIWQLFAALSHAFNTGLLKFANLVALGCNYITKYGKSSPDAVVDELGELAMIQKTPEEAPEKMKTPDSRKNYLSAAFAFFEAIKGEFKDLNKVNAKLGVPLSTIVDSFIAAGKAFAKEYDTDNNDDIEGADDETNGVANHGSMVGSDQAASNTHVAGSQEGEVVVPKPKRPISVYEL